MVGWLFIPLKALALTGCGYNDFQRLDEGTKSAWSRADLTPNLVATVSALRAIGATAVGAPALALSWREAATAPSAAVARPECLSRC